MTNYSKIKEFQNDIEKHQECMNLLLYWHTNNIKYLSKYSGIIHSYRVNNGKNQFDAIVLKRGNEIIIGFPGSEQPKDYFYDAGILTGFKNNPQQETAEEFVKDIVKQNPNCNIVLAGYSLGGHEATPIGAKLGLPTVTFNALGVKNSISPDDIKHPECVVNYCNPNDRKITMMNARNHVGTCFYVGTQENYNGNQHLLQAFKPLNTRVEFDQSQVYSKYNKAAENIHEIGIEMNKILKGGIKDFINQKIKNFKQSIINKYKNTEAFKYISDEAIWNRYLDFEENKFFNPEDRVFYQNEYNPMLAPEGSNDNLGRIFGRVTALA